MSDTTDQQQYTAKPIPRKFKLIMWVLGIIGVLIFIGFGFLAIEIYKKSMKNFDPSQTQLEKLIQPKTVVIPDGGKVVEFLDEGDEYITVVIELSKKAFQLQIVNKDSGKLEHIIDVQPQNQTMKQE